MGWTSYHAEYYKKGTVDRKAECDAYFTQGLNAGHFKVERSVLVGSVYYAAVRSLLHCVGAGGQKEDHYEPLPKGDQKVWAAVFLTSINMRDFYNFSYKDMDETCGPLQIDCPVSILNLLTPTENEVALHWRRQCRERTAQIKALEKLPLGTEIFVEQNGIQYILEKCIPMGRKGPMWIDWNRRRYLTIKKIVEMGYEILAI